MPTGAVFEAWAEVEVICCNYPAKNGQPVISRENLEPATVRLRPMNRHRRSSCVTIDSNGHFSQNAPPALGIGT